MARIEYGVNRVDLMTMDTSELLKAASIYARDLLTLNVSSRWDRVVESRFLSHQRTPAAIVPTDKKRILIAFGNIRAVVGLEHVYLLDAHRLNVRDFAHEIAHSFAQRGKRTLKTSSSSPAEEVVEQYPIDDGMSSKSHKYDMATGEEEQPYELLFLEILLRDTVDSFHRRVRLYEPFVENFSAKISSEVYSDTGVHQLVPLKDSLQSFEIQVKQSVACLSKLLENDQAMLQILLTEQDAAEQAGTQVEFSRHEHVEFLLGVYARQLAMTLIEIQFLLGRLQSKQEFVALALDAYRNRMVRINLHISIAGVCLAVGTTMAGFFGMNLVSGLEHSPVAFYYVISSTLICSLVVAMTSLNYVSGVKMKLRAIQRLDEIETLSGALSDMSAVDYTLKHTKKRGERLGKDEFRTLLRRARRSRRVTEKEADLLFEMYDTIKDGFIDADDLASLDISIPPTSSSPTTPTEKVIPSVSGK